MASITPGPLETSFDGVEPRAPWYDEVSWWLIAILAVIGYMAIKIASDPNYRIAFNFITAGTADGFAGLDMSLPRYLFTGSGIAMTIRMTLYSFVLSIIVGLLAGLGRISHNTIIRNVATAYIEFIRGIPVLVLLLVLGYSIIPDISEGLGLSRSGISIEARGIVALTIIYGAFVAEVFRAGINSVPSGQMEAARSVGMRHAQAMRHIILPQAVRNILPALGNDFIALLKDTALLSALAVSELTQQARLYSGSTFRFRESYLVLTVLYLTLTLALSLLQRWYARRLQIGER